MLGSSLSSSCMDGEEGRQAATHAAGRVGSRLWTTVACMYVGEEAVGGGGGGRSLPESLIRDSELEAHTHTRTHI